MLPEDAPPELPDSYKALLAPLLLNASLAAIKADGASNAQTALRYTTRALDTLELNNADKGSSDFTWGGVFRPESLIVLSA